VRLLDDREVLQAWRRRSFLALAHPQVASEADQQGAHQERFIGVVTNIFNF